jgi:hypothetical protein
MQMNPPSFEFFLGVFAKMPPLQLLFIILFAVTWLIGGHILIAFHYRRLGKPWWSGLKPFVFPFKDFNTREWLILLCLAITALSFGAIALAFGPHGLT